MTNQNTPKLNDSMACTDCGCTAHECAMFMQTEGISDPVCCEAVQS